MDDALKKQANIQEAFAVLGAFLESDDWHPELMPQRLAYRMVFSGKNFDFVCYAQILVDVEMFLFYVVAPIKISDELKCSVAEFITRANYDLRVGNFEMDFRDGEVRYKSSLNFANVQLTAELIKNAIYPAALTAEAYMPGLMSIVYNGKSPEEAIEIV